MIENPVYTYLWGTSQKDLPSTDELLSEISPMTAQHKTVLTTNLHCKVCCPLLGKYCY